MKFNAAGLMLCTFLIGCGSSPAPFGEPIEEERPVEEDEGEEPTGILQDGVPPGTESPSAGSVIFRSEPTEAEGGNVGDGFAKTISYNSADDTFTVDNLAFDGDNTYRRGERVSSLNGGRYNVYEADEQYLDDVTDTPSNQFTHRAIYGASRNTDAEGNPTTQFAIVRTGAYVDYGFGGFIYQRDTGVILQEDGQAIFRGQSAGLRDFSGTGGIQYTTADVEIGIDFDDFNNDTGQRGDGIKGSLTNRRIFNVNGEDITTAVVATINAEENANLRAIPDINFKVAPGALDANGDAIGELDSVFVDNNGDVETYEEGRYYAIVSGDDPNEIVGVVVAINSGKEAEGIDVRDTSGFIVYREDE